ncbi:MAG: ATP-binding cassette domain-containing protein [Planctomycetes bacterium]|nr:ATP-binding cassette domain-containing protein [Planctomycetota bacterium]
MSQAALHVRDLCFSHGNSFSLSVPSLTVEPAERVALIGPSGCGKTTLLHLIAGILTPQFGEIEVLGQRVDGLADSARRSFRARRIGLVFQEFELLDYLTADENLALPFRLISQAPNQEEMSGRVQNIASRLGLQGLLGRRPAQLSQGEKQRVALGRALVTGPGLVLGDEPTGNLDPDNARRAINLLHEQAAAERAAVLVVTHDYSLLDRFDRIIEFDGLREVSE